MKIFKKFEKTMECYKIGKNTYLILEIYIGIKKKIKLNIIRKMHIIWTLKNLLEKNRMSNFHNENSFFLTNYPNFVINNIIFPKIYKYIKKSKKSLCSIIRKFSYPNDLVSFIIILDNENSVLKENKFYIKRERNELKYILYYYYYYYDIIFIQWSLHSNFETKK